MDSYADQGFQYISVSSSDYGGNYPEPDDLASWADTYEFVDIPALGTGSGDDWQWYYEVDAYVPTYFIIGRDGTVLAADSGDPDPSTYL